MPTSSVVSNIASCQGCGRYCSSNATIRFMGKLLCKQCISVKHVTKDDWTKLAFTESLHRKHVFALFSGGKDSLCALAYVKEIVCKLNPRPSLTALHADTTISLPEVMPYVRNICEMLGVSLAVLKPEKDFATLVKEWGLPSIWKRWCCRELKIKPIRNYVLPFEDRVVFDGIRAEESRKRAGYNPIFWHRGFQCFSISPIFYWTEREVDQYLLSKRLPISPLYRSIGFSGECVCGAYLNEERFKKLKIHHSDFFNKLAQIEGNVRTGYTFLYKDGERRPLKEL